MLSGTASSGVHHTGVLEGWFGENWWNGRLFVLFVTTVFVFAPLVSLKRIGKHLALLFSEIKGLIVVFGSFI